MGRVKKGQILNPTGKNGGRGVSFSTVIKEMAETAAEGGHYTEKFCVVAKLFELAKSGDMQAIKYLIDRVEGTPMQRQETKEVTGLDDSVTDEELDAFLSSRQKGRG